MSKFRHPTFLVVLLAGTLIIPSLTLAACPGSPPAGVKCVDAGATTTVVAHGVCSSITNSHASSKAIMVPTATSTEFTSFRTHLPTGVTATSCSTGALAAWWAFDEASYTGAAGEADDGVGTQNGQAIGGATTVADSKFGRSLSLTRQADVTTGQWVKVPDSTFFDFGTSNFSMGTWVKLASGTNASVTIMANISTGTSTGIGIELSSSNLARAKLNVNSTSLTAASSTNIADGQWHHVLVTVNRTGNMIFYVDGVSAATTDISASSAFSVNTTNDFFLGSRASGSAPNSINGQMDDAAIWNRVLTPTEVTNVFNTQPH